MESTVETLQDLLSEAEGVYQGTVHEDFGQMISGAGEGEVLDIIQLIKDKLEQAQRDALRFTNCVKGEQDG